MPGVVHHDPARTSICVAGWRPFSLGRDSTTRGEYPATHHSHVHGHAAQAAPGALARDRALGVRCRALRQVRMSEECPYVSSFSASRFDSVGPCDY